MPRPKLLQVAAIERRILLIRGEKVIVDADLAAFYGVTTKRLNEQVKRNRDRFPEDFVFQLTNPEKSELVAHCDHLSNLKFAKQRRIGFKTNGEPSHRLQPTPAGAIIGPSRLKPGV